MRHCVPTRSEQATAAQVVYYLNNGSELVSDRRMTSAVRLFADRSACCKCPLSMTTNSEPNAACAKEDRETDNVFELYAGSGSDEETDADYRARIMHVDTFLRLNDSIGSLKEIGKTKPDYESEVQKILQTSFGVRPGVDDGVRMSEGRFNSSDERSFGTVPIPSLGHDKALENRDRVTITTHAHLIYHGDLLQLSKEMITLVIPKRDFQIFARIVDCCKRMLLGKHTDEDVAEMKHDHDSLIAMWEDVPKDNALNIGGELNSMMRTMLETPLYYSNSCMAMIACGQMLRALYANTEGGECESYEQLTSFVRKYMRHNPADPFACDCDGRCSVECKTLVSMIMEVPTIVHNQTYLLQILAYLMYDKSGREEVFVNNLKNICSPGLLDKIPARVAMLMGTLDESEIARHYRELRKRMQHLNPLRGATMYGKNALETLVQLANHPRVQTLIESLPGATAATVELRLPKCVGEKRQCLNKERDERTIRAREYNNNGKNKCCGYLRQDPFDVFVSSVSLTQVLVYLFTDPRTGSAKSRKHYFIRDIITSMAKQTVKIRLDTLDEMFCYLDRTRVFKSFNEHPFMMSALQELFTTYIDYMKDAAEKYKEAGKKRRMKRYLKKNGVPDGLV